MDLCSAWTEAERRQATYETIKKYVAEHNDGMKVSSLNIAQVKRKCGIEHSDNVEDRYIAIGMVGDVLFVVFTERGEAIRLISARLATEKERRLYYENQ